MMKPWVTAAMTLLIAWQSVVAMADLDQLYHPGASHHSIEQPQFVRSPDATDSQTSAHAVSTGTAIETCQQCHGHFHLIVPQYQSPKPDLIAEAACARHEIMPAAGALTSPLRPPIA